MFTWLRELYQVITGRPLLLTDDLINLELESKLRFGEVYGFLSTVEEKQQFVKDYANDIIKHLSTCRRVEESHTLVSTIKHMYEMCFNEALELDDAHVYAIIRQTYVAYCRADNDMIAFDSYVNGHMPDLIEKLYEATV